MKPMTVVPGPDALRALAHPVRLKILGLLRADGPSTATRLADRLGLNSGATSYHLRQLAVHGLVVEDDGRGNARERWWRAPHQATATREEDELSPDEREAVDAFGQAVALVHAEMVQRAVEERRTLPPEWRRTAMLSDWSLTLTSSGADRLRRAIVELVETWPEEAGADGAETFTVLADTFPRPGRLGTEEES
jgi:DNA-binding transcriptional ArsR family regulator